MLNHVTGLLIGVLHIKRCLYDSIVAEHYNEPHHISSFSSQRFSSHQRDPIVIQCYNYFSSPCPFSSQSTNTRLLEHGISVSCSFRCSKDKCINVSLTTRNNWELLNLQRKNFLLS